MCSFTCSHCQIGSSAVRISGYLCGVRNGPLPPPAEFEHAGYSSVFLTSYFLFPSCDGGCSSTADQSRAVPEPSMYCERCAAPGKDCIKQVSRKAAERAVMTGSA
jgi:hypothetical protein